MNVRDLYAMRRDISSGKPFGGNGETPVQILNETSF